MAVFRDLFTHVPRWMPHTCSCYTPPARKARPRRRWARVAPTFPLYPSQCGSCVKCRVTNVARVLYDGATRSGDPAGLRAFLEDTDRWMDRTDTPPHLFPEGFRDELQAALDQHLVAVPA